MPSVFGEMSSDDLKEDEKKSWRSLFCNTLANHRSPLNFIPQEVREGKLVVTIQSQEMKKVVMSWDNAIMFFSQDLGLEPKNIQRYIRTVWPASVPKRIYKQR